ncbi:2580_t:CDS:2 [Paraglomus occultum]|uniref:2580_t:CDS:1 n=1 Tax=Paraglomus occultum TaxID=144539 RepID=A0A9N9BN37_9GLOM|nr:2580_t:CDS:2 [Paraglomus occultum]
MDVFFNTWRLVNITFVNCPHSEGWRATRLETSLTLEKIREVLCQCDENGESIMKFDMYFCNSGGPNVIRRSEEASIHLHEILGENNELRIKRSEKVLVNIDFLNCPHSEQPSTATLDPLMTLDKIREVLSQCKNGESIMKFDMYFCNKGGPNVIPRSEEATIYLHQILGDNSELRIKRSEKIEEVICRLIEKKKLDCGIRWTENGPKQSDNVAFKFNRHEFGTHRPEYRCRFEKSNKKLCENGIEWKLDLNMSWLPFTGSIGAHFAQKGSNEIEHTSCRILERYSRKTLLMKREHIKPSEEFKSKVEQALESESQEEKRDALNEVCKKYGHFWARTIRLGGLIVKNEEEHKETNVQSTGRTIDADARLETTPMGIGAGTRRNNERLNQNSSSNSDRNIIVVGGDETAYKHEDDTEQWLETLDDCFTWEVVDYEDIVPIFEIFEGTARDAIIETFGPRICYYGINELKFSRKLLYLCVRPLKVDSDVWKGISQHQIFAEVMCDEKSDAIFTANIERMMIGPPNIHVSKIRETGSLNNLFLKNYTLKIAYIITGYPQTFNSQAVDELPVEVAAVKGEKRDDKLVASLPMLPNIQSFNQRVVLVTCYVTQRTGNYMMFAVHLHRDGANISEVCISAYKRDKNGSYKIEGLPQESVEIAYCIIPDDRQYGEIEFKLKNKIKQIRSEAYQALFSSRRFPVRGSKPGYQGKIKTGNREVNTNSAAHHPTTTMTGRLKATKMNLYLIDAK